MAAVRGLPGLLSVGVTSAHVAGGVAPSEVLIAVVGFGALLLVGYRISLYLHPHVLCRRCDGTGKVSGALFFWSRSFCMKCGGTGLSPRLGTRVLDAWAGRRRPAWSPPPDIPDEPEQWPDGWDPRRRDSAGGDPGWSVPDDGWPPPGGGWPPA